MSILTIKPHYLKGRVNIPPSKSMAHRSIICAALAKGKSIIRGIDFSDDMLATINAMRAMGAVVEIDGNDLYVDGTNTFSEKNIIIDCNESGSTLRFLVPVSIIKHTQVKFIGKGNLGKRPLSPFYRIMEEQNIKFNYIENELNLTINGGLKSGTFLIEGNISSQFISGLLFALPLLDGDSIIKLTTPLESSGYIFLTMQMIKNFGVEVLFDDKQTFKIKGNQKYKCCEYTVEGDYSQVAFYLVANALGSDVWCYNLDENSQQGDKACITLLENMGAITLYNKQGAINMDSKILKGINIDGSQYPDIIPIMTVALSLSEGESHVVNCKRLRDKECDRLSAITKELNALGANIKEYEDSMVIHGVKTLTGGEVSSHNDHRIAMSMAIAATRCIKPLILKNPECVSKSYPGFFEDYKMLGGTFEIEEGEF
ncbi:MAG: 3-phosphoshikimate 1-carboxyvinyltransferase [Cellulosilyticaceae bacterium]